ncbi:MAG TPA: fumarylacetoacetate hydrolase family protein [Planctomycetaceae bacterium]|nr:fumarylacetoacetate hydrolase family protein [Planctomycetaceae bacterium]
MLRPVVTVIALLSCGGIVIAAASAADEKVVKYARFQVGEVVAYGIVEGDRVVQLDGDLFGKWTRTNKSHALKEVKLLVPTKPSQVLAMAGNYRSHLRDDLIPPKFQIVQPFFKSPSCLVPHGADIVIPPGTSEVHFEAELVLVIGKTAKNVPESKALEHIFGVTCGNDVSARDWQKDDIQWWRAKGADTFGPCGPFLVAGLNPDNLRVQMRVNGKTLQDQSTKDFIHNCAKQVSVISQHITLHPGDLIFTGTPGRTSAIRPGDLCEVDIEGVGVLRNPVSGADPVKNDAGFVSIFNGKTLAGWHKNPERIGHGTGGSWKVEDGVIAGEQDPPGSGNGGILLTDEKFKDFELLIDMKPDWGVCSGLFVRSNDKGQCFQTMVDYHDRGNVGHIYGEGVGGFNTRPYDIFGEEKDGKLLKLFAKPTDPLPSVTPTCTSDEWLKVWKINDWNTARVRVVGNPPQITTWINGLKVNEFDGTKFDGKGYDAAKVAETLGPAGSISVQVHGGQGWPNGAKCRWKNIKVKRL